MHLSDRGLRLITSFEGFPNGGRPYNDPSRYATVGYGHLIAMRPVNPHDQQDVWVSGQRTRGRLTQPEAMRLLAEDLGDYETGVEHAVTRRMTQGQFDALVSFAYNVGVGAVRSSTLVRRLNAGDAAGAANEFMRWTKSAGRVLPGLVRRRNAERELFNSAQTDPLAGYPSNEVQMIRQYDALRRQHVQDARTRDLVARMTAERKSVWRAGEAGGWEQNHRHERYHSLLARTS
jgi:lysozyme